MLEPYDAYKKNAYKKKACNKPYPDLFSPDPQLG